jgi:hypothetical protein
MGPASLGLSHPERREVIRETGCGALPDQAALEAFLFPEAGELAAELDARTGLGFRRLNRAVAALVDEWSMVAFLALDYSDEDSVGDVLAQVSGLPQPDLAVMHGLSHVHAWRRCGLLQRSCLAANDSCRIRSSILAGPHAQGQCLDLQEHRWIGFHDFDVCIWGLQVDHAIQWGEDADVKVRDFGMGELGGEDI